MVDPRLFVPSQDATHFLRDSHSAGWLRVQQPSEYLTHLRRDIRVAPKSSSGSGVSQGVYPPRKNGYSRSSNGGEQTSSAIRLAYHRRTRNIHGHRSRRIRVPVARLVAAQVALGVRTNRQNPTSRKQSAGSSGFGSHFSLTSHLSSEQDTHPAREGCSEVQF